MIMADQTSSPRLQSAAPVFLVGDIASTMRWYQDKLGFKAHSHPPSPPYGFCTLTRDDVEIMLQQRESYRKPDLYDTRDGGVWDVYLRMKGVRDLFDAVSKLGDGTILEPLCAQPYGETEFVIKDPNGYVLVFAERTN